MKTYLEQLEYLSARLDVGLADACGAEGIALTTLARWRQGKTTCHEATARRLFVRIEAMAAARTKAA